MDLPERSWARIAWWGVWGLALYRLLVIAYGDIPLDVEEAYYYSWAAHLEAGYFSKPPLLTWVLAGVTGLLDDSPAVIKSISVFFYSGAALVIYALGARLYAPRTGAWAALTFQSLPIVGVLSLFTSTDAPLMLFWAATLYGFVRAADSDSARWWLFTGLMAGLGLLSKYTIGALAVGLVFALLAEPRWRGLLRSPRLWLGVVAALLVWSPNLWWLADHRFVTLNHTRHITVDIPRAGAWGNIGQFLLGQVAAFGPLLALALLASVWRRSLWSERANRLLLLSSLPLLLLVCAQAWHNEANLNWASPSYIGLGLLLTHWLLRHARRLLIASVALNLLLLSGMYHYHALADTFGVQLTRKTDPYFKRLGWAELGQQLVPIRRRYPQAALLSDSRKLLALLGYHARLNGRMPLLRAWNPSRHWSNQYDLYDDIAAHPQGDFLFVSRRELPAEVLGRFARAELTAVVTARVYVDLAHRVYVYHVSGFKGYR
jgi:4-amino-4-deoxy-L-arabinose transferase-like glycosyltransferase